MIYVLIAVWFGDASYNSGKAAIAQEFRTKEACMIAAEEIRRQSNPRVLMCASKGNM